MNTYMHFERERAGLFIGFITDKDDERHSARCEKQPDGWHLYMRVRHDQWEEAHIFMTAQYARDRWTTAKNVDEWLVHYQRQMETGALRNPVQQWRDHLDEKARHEKRARVIPEILKKHLNNNHAYVIRNLEPEVDTGGERTSIGVTVFRHRLESDIEVTFTIPESVLDDWLEGDEWAEFDEKVVPFATKD